LASAFEKLGGLRLQIEFNHFADVAQPLLASLSRGPAALERGAVGHDIMVFAPLEAYLDAPAYSLSLRRPEPRGHRAPPSSIRSAMEMNVTGIVSATHSTRNMSLLTELE
jgi:hypothetical protein